MPVPEDGSTVEQEFVAETAGKDRRKALLGLYLPKPRWRVRVATFEGDVAARAEEWTVYVSETGEARNVMHTLPEDRPGRVARRGCRAADCPAGAPRPNRPRRVTRRSPGGTGAAFETEGANGLALQFRRYENRGASAGGAARGRRDLRATK